MTMSAAGISPSFLSLPIKDPVLGNYCWKGEDFCAWNPFKMINQDISMHKPLSTLILLWIFKDLVRAREKGIQVRENTRQTLVIRRKDVIRDNWGQIG